MDNFMQNESLISQQLNANLPEILFHYTSSAGLLGIIETNKIRLTKTSYLNDSLELNLGINLIKEEIESQKKDINRKEYTDDLNKMTQLIRGITSVNVSVTSFTEMGDQLSQWRGYCKIGDGYSLGFNVKELNEKIKTSKFHLVPCIYNEDKQKQIVKEFINTSLTKNELGTTEKRAKEHNERFEEKVLFISQMIKEKGFEEEKEWRLITSPLDYYDAKFRPGVNSLIPYWEFDLDLAKTLLSITIGPTPEKELSKLAVSGLTIKHYLEKKRNIKIEYSKISYRSI